MRLFFCIFIICSLTLSADFITKMDYARMRYLNPRGIGCDKCHGAKGEGSVISKFKHFDKKTKRLVNDELRAPRINDLEYERFIAALENPKGVMPSYFLTDEESKILYEYIISLNKQNKAKGKK
ncbi:MAG: cytochrome c [Campylobacter sp.]|nr:cytochrome c [Campylobacter sp.]